MGRIMVWVSVTAILCYMAHIQGYALGTQDPLNVQTDIQACQKEYRTECSFEVLIYPIEDEPEVPALNF